MRSNLFFLIKSIYTGRGSFTPLHRSTITFNVLSWDVLVYETKRGNSRSQQTVSIYFVVGVYVLLLAWYRVLLFRTSQLPGIHLFKPFLPDRDLFNTRNANTKTRSQHVRLRKYKFTYKLRSGIAQVYANESSTNV